MPKMFGKGKRKKELIKNLPELLKRVQEEHMVSPSDIPPAENLQEKLANCDFTKFPTLKEKLTEAVDSMLDQDIAELMSIVPQDADEPAICYTMWRLCRHQRFNRDRAQGRDIY